MIPTPTAGTIGKLVVVQLLTTVLIVACGKPIASDTAAPSATPAVATGAPSIDPQQPSSPRQRQPERQLALDKGLILTESKARGGGGAVAACTTQGEFQVRLVVDESNGRSRLHGVFLHPEAFPETPDGFPAIIWPFGFSASYGPPVILRDGRDAVVASENDVVTLAGGAMDEVGYHVCLIDDVAYFGSTSE